jgi:hypothetical protein
MKNKIILIVIVICFGCKKSRILNIPETDVPPVYFGECSLYNNGILDNRFLPIAKKAGEGILNKNYCLSFYVYDIRNFRRIEYSFSYLYFKPSSYNITRSIPTYINGWGNDPLSGYYTIQSGGDVLEEKYWVDSTKPCVLNITRVDSATKELWGNFKGTYLLQRNASTPATYTNTIEITNGTFHTKVFE